MTQIAELIGVSPAGTLTLARRPLPAPSALEMRSLARSLDEVRLWAAETLKAAGQSEPASVWLVLNAADADAPSALTDGLDGETCAARLLGSGHGSTVVSTSGELGAAFASGFAPYPIIAVRLSALDGVGTGDAPSGAPGAAALAGAVVAGGLALRLLPCPTPFAAATDACIGSALLIRRTLGHVPAACIETLAAVTGDATPWGLRRMHARLNGDAAARKSIASAQAEASFAAIGCATLRPIRRDDGAQAPDGDRSITTELGRWTLDGQWADSQIRRSRDVLSSLKGLRASDDCVIVGNGPSLKSADPELFRRNDVIVSNFAALSPLLSETAKILTVVNGLVAEQGAAAFNLSRIPVKLAPLWLGENLHEDAGFCFVDAVGEPAFLADDPAAHVSWAATVSFFNMQIAYHLGYRRVMLVGFDHSYAQNESAAEGAVLEQKSDDPNHFDALYFAGKKWQKANLDLMQQVYILARTAFEADGREILNLSPESALTIFPMGSAPAAASADDKRPATEAAPAPARRSYALPPAEPGPGDGGPISDGPARPQRAGKRWAEPSIGGVELSDKADAPGYRHLNFGFRDVRAGERVWTYFFLKLQHIEGRDFLEIRRNDIMPVGLATWPETHARDEWGDYLRVAVGIGEPAESARLRVFLDGLTDGDRYAVSFLLGEAAGHTRKALAASEGDAALWDAHVSALGRMIDDAVGSRRAPTA